MLKPKQIEGILRELVAPCVSRSPTLLIEDRTGLLLPGVGQGLAVTVAGQGWAILPADSLLQVRRQLWERRAERVALIVAPYAPLGGLKDITGIAGHVTAGAAILLKVLGGVSVPDDNRLDPLTAILLERTDGLDLLRGQEISRPALPRAILSAVLGENLLEVASDATALARILRSQQAVPEVVHVLCREYAEAFPPPYRQLIAGLLTFEQSRSLVAQSLWGMWTSYREGQVPADPLATAFLEHAALNEVAYLEAFALCIEEAMLAEPEWGRQLVRQMPARTITRHSRIYPISLQTDIRRQVADLVAGRSTTIDDRLWREHLFCEEYAPWLDAATRLALLVQLVGEIQQLVNQPPDLLSLVQSYVERISAGDLAWLELGELRKKAVNLGDEIAQLRKTYQEARTELNRVFAVAYVDQYPHLFATGPLVVQVLNREVKPRLQAGEQALVIVADGLCYPLWQRFRADLLANNWRVQDGYALALLPTVTAVSRYAIFSGPVAARIYPSLAEPDDEAVTEDELKALRGLFPNHAVALYKKRDLKSALGEVVDAVRGKKHDLVAVVVNEVDDAVRSTVGTPFPLDLAGYTSLKAILDAARTSHRSIFLVADHGFTPDGDCKWSAPPGTTIEENRLAKGAQPGEELPAILCEKLVYDVGGPFLALYDFGGRLKAPPKIGYHGGASLEEVVVPAAWLRVGAVSPTLGLQFVGAPEQVTEDEEILLTIEVAARSGAPGNVEVCVWLPDQQPLKFIADLTAGRLFQRWQVSWRPTLPPREPVEAQIVKLRAIGSLGQAEACHAEIDVTVQPRPGKYESAVAALLP